MACRLFAEYCSERGNFAKRQLDKIYILCKAGHSRWVLIIANYRTYISISDYQLKKLWDFQCRASYGAISVLDKLSDPDRVPDKKRLSGLTIGLRQNYRTKANIRLASWTIKKVYVLLFHKLVNFFKDTEHLRPLEGWSAGLHSTLLLLMLTSFESILLILLLSLLLPLLLPLLILPLAFLES